MFKNYNCWDVVNIEMGVEFLFCFGIYFDEMDFIVVFFCDIFEDWCKVMVRVVSGGLKVDYYWKIVF